MYKDVFAVDKAPFDFNLSNGVALNKLLKEFNEAIFSVPDVCIVLGVAFNDVFFLGRFNISIPNAFQIDLSGVEFFLMYRPLFSLQDLGHLDVVRVFLRCVLQGFLL